MSALPPKADIGTQSRNVRFVPKADINLARTATALSPRAPRGECRLRPHGVWNPEPGRNDFAIRALMGS